MSCYEWERGTLTLPAKEWPKFRKMMIAFWNSKQTKVFDTAKRAHVAAQAAAKGKRGANRQPLVLAAIAKECGGKMQGNDFTAESYVSHGVYYGGSQERNEEAHELWDAVTALILTGQAWKNEATNTKNPQKKNLDVYPVSKSCSISYGECTVGFGNESRTLSWSVDENNHSRDRAHAHWFSQKLFTELSRINWTRGTGGKLLGNDEYNREAGEDYEGGGGNYVTKSFGPLGKRQEMRW